MKILEEIEQALSDIGFEISFGKYPNTQGDCGKIVFENLDKPTKFMNGAVLQKNGFRVMLRGDDYKALEQNQIEVREVLKRVGCVQIGQLEDIAPKDGEQYLQISQSFRLLGVARGGHSDEELQEAYNNGYDVGFEAGVESVDTASYYDNGYADGVASVNSQLAYVINPTTNESASILFASGSSGNHAFIDRYALARLASVDGQYVRVSGTVVCDKVMNTTTASSSTGMWKLELVDIGDNHDNENSFDYYKKLYTSAFDTQVDLQSDTADGNYETHRTPTSNIDTIELDKTFEIESNKVYVVILTYGTTGLGYYANSAVSNFEIKLGSVQSMSRNDQNKTQIVE